MKRSINRREFVISSATLAAAAALPGAVVAADMPKVDEADAQAMALGYKHDAATVDTAKFAAFQPGSQCGNCQLYTGGDAEWGGCGIFPGKVVSTKGWCSAYAKKAG